MNETVEIQTEKIPFYLQAVKRRVILISSIPILFILTMFIFSSIQEKGILLTGFIFVSSVLTVIAIIDINRSKMQCYTDQFVLTPNSMQLLRNKKIQKEFKFKDVAIINTNSIGIDLIVGGPFIKVLYFIPGRVPHGETIHIPKIIKNYESVCQRLKRECVNSLKI